MAKNKAKSPPAKTVAVAPSLTSSNTSVSIQTPGNNASLTSSFIVTGNSFPDPSTVTGILTDTVNGATFQSSPPTSASALGAWSLSFQNIPSGAYILAVNQVDSDGADAISLTIIQDPTVAALTLNNPTVATQGSTSTTVTISGACTDSLLYFGAVISSPKPIHGLPHKSRGLDDPLGANGLTFTFKNVDNSVDHTITVYPIKNNHKAQTKPVPHH